MWKISLEIVLSSCLSRTVELPMHSEGIARVIWLKGHPVVSKVTAGKIR